MQSKSMDWFLYDNGLRHERVNIGRVWSWICLSNAPGLMIVNDIIKLDLMAFPKIKTEVIIVRHLPRRLIL